MKATRMVLCALLMAGVATAENAKPVSIFVGPMTKDGFVDADKGVLDSIKDIQGILRE